MRSIIQIRSTAPVTSGCQIMESNGIFGCKRYPVITVYLIRPVSTGIFLTAHGIICGFPLNFIHTLGSFCSFIPASGHPPEIELQIVEIQFQHEGICSLLKEAYQSSDIQLDLSVKNGKTIMHYYGKATTFAGKEENYDIETKLDFAINAKIK